MTDADLEGDIGTASNPHLVFTVIFLIPENKIHEYGVCQGGKACDTPFSSPQYNSPLKPRMTKYFWDGGSSLQQGVAGFITCFTE